MPWLQLIIDSDRLSAEPIEDALLANGALSVTLQDNADEPILEPALGETPLWSETRIIGLFDAQIDPIAVEQDLADALAQPLPSHRWEQLEDKDWERCWMDNYHPMQFGRRLWICPSWKTPPQTDAVNLLLDPGLAFGTGTHPTTALCLQWLDGCELQGKTLIDYGCGSGILGIAALLLGAQQVIAVDNDPQALLATRDNAQRNRIDPERIHCYLPEQLPVDAQADIVVANILAGPLTTLATKLAALTKSGGHIALSGILCEQADALSHCYSQWFAMAPRREREGWARLSGAKR